MKRPTTRSNVFAIMWLAVAKIQNISAMDNIPWQFGLGFAPRSARSMIRYGRERGKGGARSTEQEHPPGGLTRRWRMDPSAHSLQPNGNNLLDSASAAISMYRPYGVKVQKFSPCVSLTLLSSCGCPIYLSPRQRRGQ